MTADKARILVVDDEGGVRESLRVILRPRYEVKAVASGEAALQALATFQPDLVFMDIKMPTMDGLEVLRQLKAHDATIEVVMITAYASLETLHQAVASGAFEYLIKPFSRHEVEEAARRALARRNGAGGAQEEVGRLVAAMRRLTAQAREPEAAAQEESLEQSLRVVQLSIVREISRGILRQLDLRQLTQSVESTLKAGLGYDRVSILLGSEPTPPTDDPAVVRCPIQDGETMLGSLIVDNRHSGRVIDPLEQEVLEMLAEQVAIAVRNSRLHEETRLWLRHTRALLAVNQAAGSTLELAEVVRRTTRELVLVLGADVGGAWLLSSGGDQLIPLAGYHVPKKLLKAHARSPILFEQPLADLVKHLQGPTYISESQTDPRFDHPVARLMPLKSVLAVPMQWRGDIIGGFAIVWTREAHRFTTEELKLVKAIAGQIAVAIENAQLYVEAEQRRREAEVLAELTQAISGSLDLTTVLQRVVEGAKDLCGSDLARIALRDDAVGGMIVRHRVGTRYAGYDTLRIEPGKGAGGQVQLTARPFRTAHYHDDTRISPDYLDVAREEGVVTELVVPIRIADRVEGLLYVDNRSPRVFTDRDEIILLRLADHAAVAIQNARLFEETEQRRRAAESLADVGHLISQSLDPEEVAQQIADSVRQLLACRASTLYRREPDSGRLVVLAVSGDTGSRSITPEIGAMIERPGYRPVLSIPLVVKNRMIGALSIGDGAGRLFSPDEVRLVQAFADQAATALENAQLHGELRARQARLEALLEVNRQLSRIQPVETVLRSIAEECGRLLGADSVGFRLREGEDLVVSGTWGDALEVMPTLRLKIGESLSGMVAETGEPILVRDPANDPRLIPLQREAMARRGVRGAIFLPVRASEQVLGILCAHTLMPQGFTAEDVAVATTFASQAAIALENSRLYGELRTALETLEKSQRQLVQVERLRALGEMAGGVAHDFNNTLAAILGRTQLLFAQTENAELQRHLRVIEKVAVDGARTVRRIQEFTRTTRARPFQSLDLHQIMDEVVEITRARWKDEAQAKGISYDVTVKTASPAPVVGDPSELREALTNLVFNALDAMPQGGRITLHTGIDGERVYCAVRDTGIGMTEEVRQRLFEPFFTTKGEKGTGLGLSVVYGIIIRHGGEIDVQSELGQGSIFTIWLPLSRQVSQTLQAVGSPPPPRKAKILVSEDEDEVRQVLHDLLSDEGHTAVMCGDGKAALVHLEEEAFDLVFTDLAMPGVTGWDVAKLAKHRHPDTPVVMITGWGDRITPDEARQKGVDFLVTKPFTLEEVTAVLAHALVQRDSPAGLRKIG